MKFPRRVIRNCHVNWTVGGNDQYRCTPSPAGKARQNVKRRVIAPVQIFNHDHHRITCAERLQELAVFAQHAFPGRAKDFLLKLTALFVANETRQLYHPSWRAISERSQQGWRSGSSAIILQGIDQREKCFIRPKMLNATAEQYADAASKLAFQKHLDQRRLTNTRFAGNEDQLAAATRCPLKRLFQLRDRAGSADPEMRMRQSEPRRLQILRPLDNYVCYEPVSPPGNRLDISRRLGIVAKLRTKPINRNVQA